MSFSIIVKSLDNFLNEQIVFLLNRYGVEHRKPVTYDSVMETVNKADNWPLRLEKAESFVATLLAPTLNLKDFVPANDEEVKKQLKVSGVRVLSGTLLQIALILNMKNKINILLQETADVIKEKKSSKVKKTSEELLHEKLLSFFRMIRDDLYIPYAKGQNGDVFCLFLQQVETLVDRPFQYLLEHHYALLKKYPEKNIFLNVDLDSETNFVSIARKILFPYLMMAHLPEWNFQKMQKDGKTVAIELIKDGKRRAPDVVQDKILVMLGAFVRIHALWSNKKHHDIVSKEEIQVLMNLYASYAAQTRGQDLTTRLVHNAKDVASSAWNYLPFNLGSKSTSHQRLEGLFFLLRDDVCQEQFPTIQIELVTPDRLTEENGVGLADVGMAVVGGAYSLVRNIFASASPRHREYSESSGLDDFDCLDDSTDIVLDGQEPLLNRSSRLQIQQTVSQDLPEVEDLITGTIQPLIHATLSRQASIDDRASQRSPLQDNDRSRSASLSRDSQFIS